MPKISLAGPAELLTILPYHLGFQPIRSVVVACFRGARLGLVARLDLVGPELAPLAAARLLPTLLTEAPTAVALVAFEDDRDEALPLLGALADGLDAHDVGLRERLVVREGRWWDLHSARCPEQGWPVPELADVPAVASYVALGHAVLPDRSELARLVEPLARDAPRHDLARRSVEDWQRRYANAGGWSRRGRSGRPRTGRPGGARGSGRGPGAGRARGAARAGARFGVLDDDLTPLEFLVDDALVAWGGVLRGDIVGYGIEHWLPALVGPLRDAFVRDAVIAWLCPGSSVFGPPPDVLAPALELFLGPGLRLLGAASPQDRLLGDVVDLSGPEQRADGRDDGSATEDAGGAGGAGSAGEPGGDDEAGDAGEAGGDDELLGDDGGEGDDLEDLEEPGVIDEQDALDELDDVDDLGLLDDLAGDDWDAWEEATLPHVVQARLEQVCRLTPAVHAAPLLSLVAAVAWWCGDGARARVAVDRALELEPGHVLAGLLRDALDGGLRPHRCT